VVYDDDTRLTDARAPTDHTHAIEDLTDAETRLLPASGTLGDILYHDGNSWVVLGAGAEGSRLVIVDGIPAWT